MKSYIEIADAVFEKGRMQLEKASRRRKLFRRCVTAAAFVLIAVGAIATSGQWLLKQSGETVDSVSTSFTAAQPTAPTVQPSGSQNDDVVNGVMQPFGEPITYDEPLKLIRDFPDATDGKYMCPRPGQHIVTIPLQDAVRAHADEDVVYYIRFQVINDALETMTVKQQQAFFQSEIDRMLAAGVEGVDFGITTESDADGTQRVNFFALMHDPSFLNNFPDSEQYGYFIALYDETSHVK